MEPRFPRQYHNSTFLLGFVDNLPGMAYRCLVDVDWTMEFVSGGARNLTGVGAEEIGWSRRRSLQSLIHPDDQKSVWRKLNGALKRREDFDLIYRLNTRSGETKWVWERGRGVYGEHNQLMAVEAFITDVTEHKQAEEMIAYLAYYDVLTGLPNRLMFLERLSRAIDDAESGETKLAIIFLDLNRFTIVNKTLGQIPGDYLIKMVAGRLERTAGRDVTVARLNSDEFILLYSDVGGRSRAVQLLDELNKSVFRESYNLDGQEVFVTAAMGVSFYPEHGTDVETLIKNADTAMKRAKEEGRAYKFYSRNMDERIAERLSMETRLRKAQSGDELIVHYQPKVNLLNGHIAGMEALIRWRPAGGGLIAPARFIPIAEETGLIVPFGEWMLRQAIEQNKAWQDAGFPSVPVGVNISARQFQDENLISIIRRALEASGLEPSFLELEITESCLMNDPSHVIHTLHELKALGLQISVDDFGTGYSSLSYLKRFPIDTLKVDRSFVQDMTVDPDSAAIVRAIINLAHIMGMKVVAEGVETTDQRDFLKGYNCDQIQGYLFSQPLAAEDFEKIWDQAALT